MSYPSPCFSLHTAPTYITGPLTWPFVVLAGKDFAAGVCNFSTSSTDMLLDPGEKLREMHAAEKRQEGKKKDEAAALRCARKPLIVSPEYVTQ